MKCKNCKFWDGDWMPEKGDEDYSEHQCQGGKCRRNSPKFITAMLLMIPGEDPISNAEDICFEAEWPNTLNHDWCGEFQPKD
jgi:hypothetical protein